VLNVGHLDGQDIQKALVRLEIQAAVFRKISFGSYARRFEENIKIDVKYET
jgi:hypothetical protein